MYVRMCMRMRRRFAKSKQINIVKYLRICTNTSRYEFFRNKFSFNIDFREF